MRFQTNITAPAALNLVSSLFWQDTRQEVCDEVGQLVNQIAKYSVSAAMRLIAAVAKDPWIEEGSNGVNCSVWSDQSGVYAGWDGSWTPGRWLEVFYSGRGDQATVTWETGTRKQSCFLTQAVAIATGTVESGSDEPNKDPEGVATRIGARVMWGAEVDAFLRDPEKDAEAKEEVERLALELFCSDWPGDEPYGSPETSDNQRRTRIAEILAS